MNLREIKVKGYVGGIGGKKSKEGNDVIIVQFQKNK